ncbi:MAG: N-acetyltransferase [Candidatus Zixiibacteriota bacterium]|nr:MAG: N-acetyltransferase [candidate division Zixibacteria bacterium]
MALDLEIIRKPKQLKDFFALPYRIYDGDPHWVAPLISDQKKLLDPKRHPFFDHAQMTRLIVRRNGKAVGRICAIDNRAHVEYWQEPVGFFGFFECLNDPEAARELIDAAAGWLKPRGLNALRGPMNPSTNETIGLLVDGFDSSPMVMMTYNPPWYADLLEGAGLAKIKDVYAYKLTQEDITDRVKRAKDILHQRLKVTVRPIEVKHLRHEIERVRAIYNSAWSKNWGFVPMTSAEFDHIARDMKQILDPALAVIVEAGDKPIGFSLALPDVNVALKHARGRLFPFGIIKVLRAAKHIHHARVLTMGVIEEYRNRGVDTLMYLETFERGVKAGYYWAETSWILEDNVPMNRAMDMLGGKIYKRYRIYEKPL